VELGATILGQMLTFAVFVWFTMRFVWPLLLSVMEVRKQKIMDGLAAAEKGHVMLAKVREDVELELKLALKHREDIISQANKHAAQIIADAEHEAKRDRDDIIRSGKLQVEHELHAAKSRLMGDLANIVVAGAEKILSRSITDEDHREMLEKMVQQLH